MKGRTVSFAQSGCDNPVGGNNLPTQEDPAIEAAPGTEGLEFAQDGAAYTVTGFTGTARVVVIPATHNGLPVVSIGDRAFADTEHRETLTGVTIPNSVTHIGEKAFWNNQLTNVTIPDSVTHIGTLAFADNQLTSATIGNSVISIGEEAFAGTGNRLTNVSIPDSVTSIGWGAFYCNKLLTKVTIPFDTLDAADQRWNADSCGEIGPWWRKGIPDSVWVFAPPAPRSPIPSP